MEIQLRAQFTFNFGSNVDETKFKSKVITSTDDITYNTNNTLVALNGIGRVDLTTQIDTAQINGDGYKASTSAGQVRMGNYKSLQFKFRWTPITNRPKRIRWYRYITKRCKIDSIVRYLQWAGDSKQYKWLVENICNAR